MEPLESSVGPDGENSSDLRAKGARGPKFYLEKASSPGSPASLPDPVRLQGSCKSSRDLRVRRRI